MLYGNKFLNEGKIFQDSERREISLKSCKAIKNILMNEGGYKSTVRPNSSEVKIVKDWYTPKSNVAPYDIKCSAISGNQGPIARWITKNEKLIAKEIENETNVKVSKIEISKTGGGLIKDWITIHVTYKL